MILEGILITQNADGSPNISPMGPVIEPSLQQFVLKPFKTSRTYQNLKVAGHAVFHVTDDVELFAQAAVGSPEPMPELSKITDGDWVLKNACRWFRLKVMEIDDASDRAEIVTQVVEQAEFRPFLGFNRAKHAVLEAAILATRTHLLPQPEIRHELQRLEPLVSKTGGASERRAFEFLKQEIAKKFPKSNG